MYQQKTLNEAIFSWEGFIALFALIAWPKFVLGVLGLMALAAGGWYLNEWYLKRKKEREEYEVAYAEALMEELADDEVEEEPQHAALSDPLTPRGMSEIVGQQRAKEILRLMIAAAENENRRLEHTLFTGPGGTGKTALAKALAHDVDAHFVFATASNLNLYKPHKGIDPLSDRIAEADDTVTHGKPFGILFIDEIHRLSPSQWERLYALLEGGVFELEEGCGEPGVYKVPNATIIGATTDPHMLNQSVKTRFRTVELAPYTNEEMASIVSQGAGKLGVDIEHDAALLIAANSRQNPRLALNTFVRQSREVALAGAADTIAKEHVEKAVDLAGVVNQDDGLSRVELAYLEFLAEVGRAGLMTLVAGLGENRENIEKVIEPFLVSRRYIIRGPRGREITDKGRQIVETLNS